MYEKILHTKNDNTWIMERASEQRLKIQKSFKHLLQALTWRQEDAKMKE